jgi:tetrahydromethanopterin S-methyltransferase subunit A
MEFNEYKRKHFSETQTQIETAWNATGAAQGSIDAPGLEKLENLIGSLKAITASDLEKIANERLNNFEAGVKAFNFFEVEKENHIIEEYRSDLVIYLQGFLRDKLTS